MRGLRRAESDPDGSCGRGFATRTRSIRRRTRIAGRRGRGGQGQPVRCNDCIEMRAAVGCKGSVRALMPRGDVILSARRCPAG